MRFSRATVLLMALSAATAGCHGGVGDLTARATDEWRRSYPLSETGEVSIANTNGKIEVEGVDGSTVEVVAERVARATTDASARELLPRIGIKEEIKPDRISLETERIPGIIIGVSFQVNYHVRVPWRALVRARTTNGEIAVEGVRGRTILNSTNGNIGARELSGGVEARATNGQVTIELRAVGEDPVDVRTTNGSVKLTFPAGAKANVSASCTNGTIDVTGVTLDLMGEQSRRRVRGRMNGGGTPIEVATVNGRVTIAAR